MSRNNDDRLGAANIQADPPIPQVLQPQSHSADLSFIVPTEFVDLPSRGRFYSEEHPLHAQECIEIKHMTAKEEDILSDQTLLKKGLAIDRFLRNIIIDKRVKPSELLIGDRNAILVSARMNGYGPDYDTKVICPVCFSHGRHVFDLEEVCISGGFEEDEVEAQITPAGTFIIVPPRTNVEVECRLLTGADETNLVNASEKKNKKKLPSTVSTDMLRAIIVSARGNSDRAFINSFIEILPAGDSRYIKSTYQKCIPNVDLTQQFDCDACGASADMDLPFTTDFFWPNT